MPGNFLSVQQKIITDNSMDLKIVYFGTSEFAVPALFAINKVAKIPLVVTQPAKKAGRGGKLTDPPIFNAAKSLNLSVLQPESCKDAEFVKIIEEISPDLIVVAAYGQFLPGKLLEIPRFGAVNIHGSLLPHLRGAAPIQRAIQNGDKETGVTLIYMTKKMDAGDMISSKNIPLNANDTYGILHEKISIMGAELFIDTLPDIVSENVTATPQNECFVTFAPPIDKSEREIDWSESAVKIHRKVMGFNPNPIAVANFKNAPLKIYLTKVVTDISVDSIFLPGQVVCANKNNGLIIFTGDGFLEILQLQPAGKNIMSGIEFVNGYQVKTLDKIFL